MDKELENFSSVSNYRGILLDAYGVFWGGNALGPLPGAAEMMEKLVSAGNIVGILSNATQPSSKEISKIARSGLIEGQHFHFFITSGDIAREIFLKNDLPFKTPRKKLWLFGGIHPRLPSHESVLKDTGYTLTEDPDEADFAYIAVPHVNGEDQTDPEIFRAAIHQLKERNLPLVCPNPDRFAHEGNPPQAFVRQGTIAALYEEAGGEVFYIGKPHATIFHAAMESFSKYNILLPEEILMVGDTPETDIRGAHRFGMSSALVTETGIMADRISHHGFEQAMKMLSEEDRPHHLIKRFSHDV